jgi:Protein of unknown function (Hypoth_ymh)
MRLADLMPNADVLIALEPDELGLQMLPVLLVWPHARNPMQLGHFLRSIVGDGRSRDHLGQFPPHQIAEVELALREAWAWLEGAGLLMPDPKWQHPSLVRILSRRARQFAREVDPRRAFSARHLPKESLHSKIREDVWQDFHRGKYDTAVFEAMKAVEVAVRDAVADHPCAPLLGVKL